MLQAALRDRERPQILARAKVLPHALCTLAIRAKHAFLRLAPLVALAACMTSSACRELSSTADRSEPREAAKDPVAPLTSSDERPGEERPLKVPSGEPPRLACAQARAIVAEVRRRLPAEPPRVAGPVFADLWTDSLESAWLVVSRSRRTPGRRGSRTRERAAFGARRGGASAPCSVALSLGADAKHWVDGLRGVFEQARAEAPPAHFQRALSAINEPAFEDDSVSHPARQLAADLGLRIGQFSNVAPELADGPASSALSRFLPDLSAEAWSEVALAAAVRAYVPSIDPHGQWAPLEEEWALFAGDPLRRAAEPLEQHAAHPARCSHRRRPAPTARD